MGSKHKILVVDDTEATRYAISRTLRNHGYTIIEAANGQDALTLAEAEQPDLITLDIHLPDILGFEVCRRIKHNPTTAHIAILQVSASYVTSKDRIHGLEGGADSYLTHPFEPQVLVATVLALLRTKKLNEDLLLSEERFRVALSNAPIMIYACDLNLRYTWVYNPIAPYDATDLIGNIDHDLFPAEQAARLDKLKRGVIATRTGDHASVELTTPLATHYLDITIEPAFNAANIMVGLTVACIDVTDRMVAEKSQRTAVADAKLANQAKSQFLSNMSHEIRTPLGIIQGFIELLADPEIHDSDRQEYLSTLRRNAQNLSKLIGEILDLSKIEAGRIEIEAAPFKIAEVLENVTSALRIQARDKNIALRLNIEQPFPELVHSDETRVQQILTNLLSNAIKFTQNGHVVVHARYLHSDFDLTDRIEVVVEDTGIGLDENQQNRLFTAFMQADSSTTRKYGGTGLGLNLSKSLAQSLGGNLELVASEPGVGSEFKFYFPATNAILKQTTVSQAEPSPILFVLKNQLPGLRVLLIDDAVDNQILFARYLKRAGAIVDTASNGIMGAARAKNGNFDVILMDIQMPFLDGYQAAEQIRAAGIATPIVALTAHALKEERERATERGFSAYLTKPLNPETLVNTLKTVVDATKV